MGERLTQRSQRSQRGVAATLSSSSSSSSSSSLSNLLRPLAGTRALQATPFQTAFSDPKVQFPQRSKDEDDRRNRHSREAPLALLYPQNSTRNPKSKMQSPTLKAPIPVAPPRPFSATAIDPSVFRFFPAHSPARSPLELTLEAPPRVHGEHFANAFLSLLSPATEIANSAVPPDHQLTGAKSLVSNWLA